MQTKHWCLCATFLILSAACGNSDDFQNQPDQNSGKMDTAQIVAGVEANLPVEIVTRLHNALQQGYVEKEGSRWYSNYFDHDVLKKVFRANETLLREFDYAIRDKKKLQKIYQYLQELLHNGYAIRKFSAELAAGHWNDAYKAYKKDRDSLMKKIGDVSDKNPPENSKPTIVINIPSEKLYVFHGYKKYKENPVVVGKYSSPSNGENTKTRVGDYYIKEWQKCYSNADYPSWCNDKWDGAFGKYTAILDRSYQYIHGTIGGSFIDWWAIRTAPGSHGCIRNQNSDISRIKEIAPAGSFVRKIYARRVRYAKYDPQNGVRLFYKKYDNMYKYHNTVGVFYPSTGVTIDYVHPTDALGSKIHETTSYYGNPCTANGIDGVCKPVDLCEGTPVPGFCPGPSSMQCCIND